MPFHAMTGYPYPVGQHYPDDVEATAYRLDWNDRYQTGASNATGYRFLYKPRTMDPEPLTPHDPKPASLDSKAGQQPGEH